MSCAAEVGGASGSANRQAVNVPFGAGGKQQGPGKPAAVDQALAKPVRKGTANLPAGKSSPAC
jgi:hypothetical protein